MWGYLMFDNLDVVVVVFEVNECCKEYGGKYICVIVFDVQFGWEFICMSFIVNCFELEFGFCVICQEVEGCFVCYMIESYVMCEFEGVCY